MFLLLSTSIILYTCDHTRAENKTNIHKLTRSENINRNLYSYKVNLRTLNRQFNLETDCPSAAYQELKSSKLVANRKTDIIEKLQLTCMLGVT